MIYIKLSFQITFVSKEKETKDGGGKRKKESV